LVHLGPVPGRRLSSLALLRAAKRLNSCASAWRRLAGETLKKRRGGVTYWAALSAHSCQLLSIYRWHLHPSSIPVTSLFLWLRCAVSVYFISAPVLAIGHCASFICGTWFICGVHTRYSFCAYLYTLPLSLYTPHMPPILYLCITYWFYLMQCYAADLLSYTLLHRSAYRRILPAVQGVDCRAVHC